MENEKQHLLDIKKHLLTGVSYMTPWLSPAVSSSRSLSWSVDTWVSKPRDRWQIIYTVSVVAR
jgi:hypothetical protein